jgi:hypothetical protein
VRQTYANQLTIVIAVIVILVGVLWSWFQSTGAVGFVPGPSLTTPPLITHAVFGYQNCINCHGLDGPVPYPPDHLGYANAVCTGCHVPTGVDTPPHELFPDNNNDEE